MAKRARAILLVSKGQPCSHTAQQVALGERHWRNWFRRFIAEGIDGLKDRARPGRPPVFHPQVALYLAKIACELPDRQGRSLCLWNCTE